MHANWEYIGLECLAGELLLSSQVCLNVCFYGFLTKRWPRFYRKTPVGNFLPRVPVPPMHAFMKIIYTYSHFQLRSGHQKLPIPTWFLLLFTFIWFWTLKRLSKCHIFINRHLRRVYGSWTAWLKSLLSWQFSLGSSKKVLRVIQYDFRESHPKLQTPSFFLVWHQETPTLLPKFSEKFGSILSDFRVNPLPFVYCISDISPSLVWKMYVQKSFRDTVFKMQKPLTECQWL